VDISGERSGTEHLPEKLTVTVTER